MKVLGGPPARWPGAEPIRSGHGGDSAPDVVDFVGWRRYRSCIVGIRARRAPRRDPLPRRTRTVDLSATIHLLGEVLGDVLRTQESVALFETEERIRALAKACRLDDKASAERLAAEVRALS